MHRNSHCQARHHWSVESLWFCADLFFLLSFAGSPAKLSLAQAAEAELAKVEQDHAPEQPPADGKEETPLVAANSRAAKHTRRSDDRYGKLLMAGNSIQP